MAAMYGLSAQHGKSSDGMTHGVVLCGAVYLGLIGASTVPAGTSTAAVNLYAILRPEELRAEIAARHRAGEPLAVRLERVTRGLVAAPYVRSPLGEGRGRDTDPRIRFDAFDCTTFVETALALARCDDLDALGRILDLIRYTGGRVGFVHRRHLMTSQWIPELVDEGWLVDVTAEVGGDVTQYKTIRMTPRRWKRRRVARSLVLPQEVVPSGKFSLPVLPIAAALARMEAIPPGTVVNVVRDNWKRSPDLVTHQGLVLRSPVDGSLVVRHASPVFRRVVDEPLVRLLTRYLRPRKWPIIGVNLLRVVP